MAFASSLTVNEIGDGAALALETFRVMAAGADPGAVIAAFDRRFGFPGRLALGALHLLVREIGAAGGGRVAVACPGCCRLTGDEVRVLEFLAAAQRRDHQRLGAYAAGLLSGRDDETARMSALAVARLFNDAGLSLESPATALPALRTAAGA